MAFGQVSHAFEIKEVPLHSGEIRGRQCHFGMRKSWVCQLHDAHKL